MKYSILVLSFFLIIGCQTVPHSTRGAVDVVTNDARVRILFSDDERHLIHSYYYDRYHPRKLPPGLAKKEQLPPGLQKQLVRNGKLPPGLEGRHLPYELERHLRRLPEDYIRVIIGTDVVLMNRRTRVIFDVISDVAF